MNKLLLAIDTYQDLARKIAGHGGYELCDVELKIFPDGERYRRILTSCSERDVVLLGGTPDDRSTLDLYDLACALVYYGARRLTLVLPFFGYSTMERAVKSGEVVTAKARARLFSSIPPAAMGNRIVLMDLHVPGIAHYFEGALQPVHVSARPVIEQAMKDIAGEDFVLACTDAGRAKWVEKIANELGVSAAFAYKRRVSGESAEVVGVSAHVSGKEVVIYDDMIRTGASLLGAARAYLDAGAARVSAVVTHGVFPDGALEAIESSGLLAGLASTDTHPRAAECASQSGFLSLYSVADLLHRVLEEDHGGL
jgi:ribose-phosphate pyrophosphokinase